MMQDYVTLETISNNVDRLEQICSELFDKTNEFDFNNEGSIDEVSNTTPTNFVCVYYRNHCSTEFVVSAVSSVNKIHITKRSGDGFAFGDAIRLLKRALHQNDMFHETKKKLPSLSPPIDHTLSTTLNRRRVCKEKTNIITFEYIHLTVEHVQYVIECMESKEACVRTSAIGTLAGISNQPFFQTVILVNVDIVIPLVIKYLSDPDTVNNARRAATVLKNLLQIEGDQECVKEIRSKVIEYNGVMALIKLALNTATAETIREAAQVLIGLLSELTDDDKCSVTEKFEKHSCFQIRQYGKLFKNKV